MIKISNDSFLQTYSERSQKQNVPTLESQEYSHRIRLIVKTRKEYKNNDF